MKQEEKEQQADTIAELVASAQALLKRLDNITTKDFSLGGERTEREALRKALAALQVKGEE